MTYQPSHLKQKLIFTELNRAKLTMDVELRLLMQMLWSRKRITGAKRLYQYYEQAFDQFLFENKIPRIIPKVMRKRFKLECSPKLKRQLKGLEAIARRRQQPLAVIIEEAVRRYLEKPENYLGKDNEEHQKLERII